MGVFLGFFLVGIFSVEAWAELLEQCKTSSAGPIARKKFYEYTKGAYNLMCFHDLI